jgi:hypothetical protein
MFALPAAVVPGMDVVAAEPERFQRTQQRIAELTRETRDFLCCVQLLRLSYFALICTSVTKPAKNPKLQNTNG